MSYIDLETESGKFRTTLTCHEWVVDPSQLSPDSTGLLMELLTDKPTALHSVPRSFRDLITVAKIKHLPIGLSEPTLDWETLISMAKVSLWAKTPSDLLYKAHSQYLFGLALMSHLIPFPSASFDSIEQRVEYCLGHKQDAEHDRLRDLLAAQRAVTFARYQRAVEGRNPVVDIVVGATHVGIIRALVLPEDKRMVAILDNPIFNQYYSLSGLNHISMGVFNDDTQDWDSTVIATQPNLNQ